MSRSGDYKNGKIGMKLSDLCELYILVDLYEKTYGQPEITVGELKEIVRKKCGERGMTNEIRNSRDAGRKKKYSEETDRKISCNKGLNKV